MRRDEIDRVRELSGASVGRKVVRHVVEDSHDERFAVQDSRQVGQPAVVQPREKPEIIDLFIVPAAVDARLYRECRGCEGKQRADA